MLWFLNLRLGTYMAIGKMKKKKITLLLRVRQTAALDHSYQKSKIKQIYIFFIMLKQLELSELRDVST